jgi:5-formyltetrahydrofolate cyclo-ligase
MDRILEEKARLRKHYLAALREILPSERARFSAEIVQQIRLSATYQAAQVVMIYAPLANEPDLLALFNDQKKLIFPKVTPQGLTLHEVHAVMQLQPTTGRLREPVAGCPAVPLSAVDVVYVPGLAFASTSGVRLGRGGGYYDRLLGNAAFRARRIGVCFDTQLVTTLPQETHDLTVQEIITHLT